MMEKHGTKNSSPKVDGKRAAKENDSAKYNSVKYKITHFWLEMTKS